MAGFTYSLTVIVYFLLLLGSWCLTLFGLPGNWAMVALSAGFAALYPSTTGHGIGWTTVGILAGIALLGEVLELLAGAAGVAKGGSRRGAILAILGSFAGSLLGAGLGLPIPLIGSAIGIVLGACLGAMAGAIVGELWAGKTGEHSLTIGTAAFWGRLLGTAAKVTIGSILIATGTMAAIL